MTRRKRPQVQDGQRANHSFPLAFQQILCNGCGNRRIARIACPDCGYRPRNHEVDYNLWRRRQIATNVLAVIEGDEGHAAVEMETCNGWAYRSILTG